MAEVQSRPSASRGRGSTRGRGGYSSRGGGRPASKPADIPQSDSSFVDPLEEDSELGQLKKKYNTQLNSLKDMFPDWTLDDLVFALQETDGDVETAVDRITDGSVSRFNDVKKKPREKSRAKGANDGAGADGDQARSAGPRGGRGRGTVDGARGGRGRGSERGRGATRGGRGGAGAAVNGGRSTSKAIPSTADSGAWGNTTSTDAGTTSSWDQPASAGWGTTEPTATGAWDDTAPSTESKAAAPAAAAAAAAPEAQKSSLIPEGTTKSWASMLAKPKAASVVPKQATPPAAVTEPETEAPVETTHATEPAHDPVATDWGAAPSTNDAAFAANETTPTATEAAPADSSRITSSSLPPPKDPLTEDNLEHLPDSSGRPATETVASTRDPRSTLGSAQPSFQGAHGATPTRPTLGGGYATTAQKAAGHSGRSLSFQRLKEQQDAVVMPGNHAIDRTAVQFGSMNLDGESKPLDPDDEREDAATRAQPPQQSPSQPRASLPPAPRGPAALSGQTAAESLPTTKHAPGFPTPRQHQNDPVLQASQIPGAPGLTQPATDTQHYSQLGGRYGGGFGQDANAPSQKPYDPFSSQLYPQSQNDPSNMYSGLSQAPGSTSYPATSQAGGYPQSHGEYGSQYPSNTSRGGYSSYYGAYNQPTSSLQENMPPQRATSGYGINDSSLGGAHPAHTQARYGEGQASGNNTPNPQMGSQQHHSSSHSHHNQHMHHQSHGHGGYGPSYGAPYGSHGYYQQYSNQGYPNYYGSYGQGYGGPYGGKHGGMYGGAGHHQYGGISSHGSHDNTNSPATTGAFGSSSLQGRESSISSGLNDYPRSGSTQPPSQSQHSNTAGGFGSGSMADTYGGRSSSGFGSHNQGFGAIPVTSANEESIKSLHDSKTGPSPLGQSGRPGSGFNTNNPSSQNYGAPGAQQQGFGGSGYPSHLGGLHNQYGGSGYGGIGGLGQHGGSHNAQSGYGGYGSSFGNNSYGSRGGWGSQYGNQYGQH